MTHADSMNPKAEITDDFQALWEAALKREATLGRAVIDVCWKAAPYGQTEDGDTYAYIVPKGAMHRLIGAAQSTGHNASFRAM